MINFSSRQYIIVDIADVSSVGLNTDIRLVLLRFSESNTVDIGALCYPNRDHSKRTPNKRARLVELNSATDERTQSVLKLLGVLATRKSRYGNRDATIYAMSLSLERFLKWSDLNGFLTTLQDKSAATEAYGKYTHHLIERVRRHEVTISTAATEQQAIKSIFVDYFEDHHYGSECRNILKIPGDRQETSPPSEDVQGKVLALAHAIFQGFSELVVKSSPFPYQLTMPRFLKWDRSFIWIFPLRDWIRPPMLAEEHAGAHRGNIAYDYSNGKMFSIAEIRRETTQRRANRAFYLARKRLDTANADTRDFARVHFASVAHNAFFVIFLSITSMNEAQATALPWSSSFEVHSSRMKFKVVKYRAGGKLCSFEISAKSLPLFYQFLELRKYLIGEHTCDWLFITLGVNNQSPPSKMGPQKHQTLFNSLRKFDPTLPVLGSRKWRAAKSDYTISTEENIIVGAHFLQNSVSTFEKNYTAGSEQTHHEEMSRYFSGVHKSIMLTREELLSSSPIVNGRCQAPNHPSAVNAPSTVKVDCTDNEGCFFCENYRLHPDREDISKLLSARFYIDAISRATSTVEDFEKFYEPVLTRIDAIIKQIENTEASYILEEASIVVKRGNLTPFWTAKISMLQLAGLI